MIEKSDLLQVKKSLEKSVGQKVQLKAKKSRNKSVVRHGVIESTYPSIFIVKIEDDQQITRRVSYSYTDVLTKTVELVLCSNEHSNIQYS